MNVVNMSSLRVACSNCNLKESCLPSGLSLRDVEALDDLVVTRRRVKRGEVLYHAGDRFQALYAVRLGFLKGTVMSSDGREQVTNFFMAGEWIGMDGIANGVHSCDVTCLEDTDVCVIPYERIQAMSMQVPAMGLHFHKILSHEIVRQHGVMLLLGSMHAEERLAAFLLTLAHRFEERGYSRSEFVLRMTRAEIGSYLGLKLETVSRVLSRFHHDGCIEVNQKHVRIFDPEALRAIVSGTTDHDRGTIMITQLAELQSLGIENNKREGAQPAQHGEEAGNYDLRRLFEERMRLKRMRPITDEGAWLAAHRVDNPHETIPTTRTTDRISALQGADRTRRSAPVAGPSFVRRRNEGFAFSGTHRLPGRWQASGK